VVLHTIAPGECGHLVPVRRTPLYRAAEEVFTVSLRKGSLLHRRVGRQLPLFIHSEMLGNASIAITLDTYSHVLPDMRDQAAAATEDVLS